MEYPVQIPKFIDSSQRVVSFFFHSHTYVRLVRI